MNVVKKYWASVYVYILLLIPGLCMCAGIFWTIFKLMGHYESLSWIKIMLFDCSQIFYFIVSFYLIYRNKKDATFIHKNLRYVKTFVAIALFVQYNFILYLFPSEYVWGCTFLFFAIIVFFFDTKLTVINLFSYQFSLLIAHLRNPKAFLPVEREHLAEVIAFKIVILLLTTLCIVVIVYFAERFFLQATEKEEENMRLVKKQLKYYEDLELLDTEIRKFRHDINNHFSVMAYLLQSGKQEELKKYFQDLQMSNGTKTKLYFSGNEIIDAILYYDLTRDCQSEVCVKIHGELPLINTVSAMDLCTIFSNLLSNAINSANECLKTEKSKIDVWFSYGKKYFSIGISNTILSENIYINNKKDKNHGFGINKIKDVLEKYNGKWESNLIDKTISIKIYLPI